MNRVHLMVLLHMHQRSTAIRPHGPVCAAMDRLHALKEYWGMFESGGISPRTRDFNVVPSSGATRRVRQRTFRRAVVCYGFPAREGVTPDDNRRF